LKNFDECGNKKEKVEEGRKMMEGERSIVRKG
jgi:hypothetical protein